MGIKNTTDSYGWLSIGLHWVLACVLIAMYFVGDWMVDLDYYSRWYYLAPEVHEAVGLGVGVLMVFRLLWNIFQTKPKHLNPDEVRNNQLATFVHYCLYLMVFVMVVTGYLISTAEGDNIDIFGLFEVPALVNDIGDGGDLVGDIHEWLGLGFILIVALHACAALLHHFKYKDRTLKRMLGVKD